MWVHEAKRRLQDWCERAIALDHVRTIIILYAVLTLSIVGKKLTRGTTFHKCSGYFP